MLLILKRKQNVYDVINIKQHELLGFEVSCPLPDVMNSLAVVEDVLSRFFQATAAASTIGHVCQAHFEVQTEKGQRVPCNQPFEQELQLLCPFPAVDSTFLSREKNVTSRRSKSPISGVEIFTRKKHISCIAIGPIISPHLIQIVIILASLFSMTLSEQFQICI